MLIYEKQIIDKMSNNNWYSSNLSIFIYFKLMMNVIAIIIIVFCLITSHCIAAHTDKEKEN